MSKNVLSDFSLFELNLLFVVRDGLLYWRERGEWFIQYKRFNSRYANKIAGFIDKDTGVQKVCLNYNNKVSSVLSGDVVLNYMYGFCDGHKSTHRYFRVWSSLTRRVGKAKVYKDVTLYKDWYDFDNFLAWANDQKGFMSLDDKGNIFVLEKDILSKGERRYHPSNCVFVPHILNSMCVRRTNTKFMRGVQYFPKKKNPYRSYFSVLGDLKHGGYFLTEVEAHNKAQEMRREYLKGLEDMYGEMVDDRVFPALYEDCKAVIL